jgi:ribulose-5-phosphate 4-epimerase/fuculose-1-phosphate aldolase
MTARKLTALPKGGMAEPEHETRLDLAACYRLTAHFGYDDTIWNHISARIPGQEAFLINPLGYRYDEICASNLVKVDLDGRVLDVGGETNLTGFVIHSAVHRRRPDAGCVMHTHSEGGLAVSAMAEGLLPMVQDAFLFHERVRYHAYEGLSTDLAERERLAESLGDGYALILRNHGLLTVGQTVGEAFMIMHYLERACRVQIAVLSTGREISLPPPELRDKAAEQYRDFWPGTYEWPALVRLMDKVDPSFRA